MITRLIVNEAGSLLDVGTRTGVHPGTDLPRTVGGDGVVARSSRVFTPSLSWGDMSVSAEIHRASKMSPLSLLADERRGSEQTERKSRIEASHINKM